MEADRLHVLVVDDQPDTADSTAMLLGLWGYDGEARYDGAAALASARARPPAAVLVDLGMPGMDGFEFVARLHQLRRCGQTPVVVITGYTGALDQARARDLGIAQYLFKPVDLARLRATLGRLVVTPRRRPRPSAPGIVNAPLRPRICLVPLS